MKKGKKKKPDDNPASTKLTTTARVKLGRRCSICFHLEVAKINSLIGEAKSFRAISCQIGGDESMRESIRRHTENCLKLDIHALIEEKRIDAAVEHYEEIREQLQFGKELQQAAREWLTDPASGRITLTPRANEVQIIYLDHMDLDRHLHPKKKKESLQEIIDNVQACRNGFDYSVSVVKTADLREYALKNIGRDRMNFGVIPSPGGLPIIHSKLVCSDKN